MGRSVESFAPAPSGQTGDSLGTTAFDISTSPGFIGTVVTTTDAAGKKGRSFTNALGQLIRVDEPDHAGGLAPLVQSTPNPTPTPFDPPIDPPGCSVECLTNIDYPSYSTVYQYYPQGKMAVVTQDVQKRFFLYDALGRLIRVRSAFPWQKAAASIPKGLFDLGRPSLFRLCQAGTRRFLPDLLFLFYDGTVCSRILRDCLEQSSFCRIHKMQDRRTFVLPVRLVWFTQNVIN